MTHVESDHERQARQLLRLAELEAENQRLREAIEEYILWEPGKRGHAAAHRRLVKALAGDTE